MSVYAGPEIADSGLLLHLDAGNTKSYPGYGTAWTDTVAGNVGTCTNGPVYSFLNGGYFVFDGIDDYVQFGNYADNLSTFTISAWIKTTSNSSIMMVIAKLVNYSNGAGWGLFLNSGTLRLILQKDGSNWSVTYTTQTLNDGNWHHVAIVVSTYSVSAMYIDGIAYAQTLASAGTVNTTSNAVNLRIGTDNAPEYYFNGSLSAVTIHQQVLTAAQVLQSYNATRGRYQNLPFSPIDISGLQLWLDASEAKSLFSDTAGTTLATTDGTSIALWKDKSGNSRNLAQSTSGNRPVLKKAVVNSLDGIRFDGTNDYLDYATNIRPSAYSVFVVVNKTTTSSVTFCGASDTAGNGHARYFEISSGFYATNDIGIITGNGTDSYKGLYTQNSAGNLIVNNTPTVLSMTSSVTGSGTTLELFKNNSAPATTVIGANITSVAAVNRNFAVGRLGDYNGNYLQGDIYEILIYNSALTTTQRQQVESYLNTKWKVY